MWRTTVLGLAAAGSLVRVPAVSAHHAHFDAESAKPGVAFSRTYRTQAEIDLDWKISGGSPAAGEYGAAYYHSGIDGAALPIIKGYGFGGLRENNQFTPFSGDIWVQYETYFQQEFYDFDFVIWDSMKVFRMFAVPATCSDNDDRLFTPTFVGDAGDAIKWKGNHCGIPIYSPGYVHPADEWTRVTINIDVPNKEVNIWVTDLDTDTSQQLVNSYESSMTAGLQINQAAPMFHSSSRDPNAEPDHEDFFIGYRNLIVSKNEIARNNDEIDNTPPSKPVGLHVVE